MQRRNVLLVLGSFLIAPASLIADASDRKRPEKSCCCKDCKCRECYCRYRKPHGPESGSNSRGRSHGPQRRLPPADSVGRSRSHVGPERKPERDMRGKHPHHRGRTHAHPQRGGLCPQCRKPHSRGRRR